MSGTQEHSNLTLDDHVEQEIAACLDLEKPVSFFLFAGAGSGKTRSLVNGLIHIQRNFGTQLKLRGQRVAVITYTNAARDEIISRIKADALFHVATIHRFAWTLIEGYNKDIRNYLRTSIRENIAEVEMAEAKGRKGTKASADRIAQIESYKRRLARLDEIRKFTYNPNGDNREKNSLNHAEVIAITAKFIGDKPTMQSILTQR
jgi:DNA helicase-2/ATP-dependent DNA helicase PcrA